MAPVPRRAARADAIPKAREIVAFFERWDLDPGGKAYVRFQSRRYVCLLDVVHTTLDKIRSSGSDDVRILDIGPAYQTELLRQSQNAIVNTAGFEDLRFRPRPAEKHFQFDLNDAQYPERWPRIEHHDLVVMAEVIEHLYTSPKLVLRCVATWLKEGGYLIVQTPNAVSMRRRLKMLVGKHPYEMIRDTRTNPGHFREYTVSELMAVSQEAGFTVTDHTIHNYFGHKGIAGRAYNALCRILPEGFRDGITICLQKR